MTFDVRNRNAELHMKFTCVDLNAPTLQRINALVVPYFLRSALLGIAIAVLPTVVDAAQLRVEPVLLEISAPAAAATLTLRNDDDVEISAQTRVYRWVQSNGKETLEPATGVVASPPTLKLKPRSDNVVRVVRTDRQPIEGQENYRVIVDQIPQPQNRASRTINLLVRQSIPVFFRSKDPAAAVVSWSFAHQDGKLMLIARNDGDEHLRVASLQMKSSSGLSVGFGNGLLGYVLGRSTMSWVVPTPPRKLAGGEQIAISAMGNKGAIHAVALAPNGR